MIDFEYEFDSAAGWGLVETIDAIILEGMKLSSRLAELGVTVSDFRVVDWQTIKMYFHSENDALVFKLACEGKIVRERHYDSDGNILRLINYD